MVDKKKKQEMKVARRKERRLARSVEINLENGCVPVGRPPREHHFTEKLRKALTDKKTFKRQDGSLIESSELDLIIIKVIRELRTTSPVNVKLLEIVLNRIEGKPKELVEIDGSLEVSRGIDARDVLLQRLSKIVDAEAVEGDDTESES